MSPSRNATKLGHESGVALLGSGGGDLAFWPVASDRDIQFSAHVMTPKQNETSPPSGPTQFNLL